MKMEKESIQLCIVEVCDLLDRVDFAMMKRANEMSPTAGQFFVVAREIEEICYFYGGNADLDAYVDVGQFEELEILSFESG